VSYCSIHGFEPREPGIPTPPSCPMCAEEAAAKIDAQAGRTISDLWFERAAELAHKRRALPAAARRALREQEV
jgi:hypothetical protein